MHVETIKSAVSGNVIYILESEELAHEFACNVLANSHPNDVFTNARIGNQMRGIEVIPGKD